MHKSHYAGHGVKIAVLDTGFDESHTDFIGRGHTANSFLDNVIPQDQNGHGTHCVGTALGPKVPSSGVRRYGCAYGGEIFSGKVLSDEGVGSDYSVIRGIEWAIAKQCRVISMSLSHEYEADDDAEDNATFELYESIAKDALEGPCSTLIVAAAGNNSSRTNVRSPVSIPAKCPSIVSVGAVNLDLETASFSHIGADFAAPGVDVFSSYLRNGANHKFDSGTSMATPHVAGIAAMWLEAKGQEDITANELLDFLKTSSIDLKTPDFENGLIQAPTNH